MWASRKLPMFEVSQVEVLHTWDRRCFWALGYGAGAWEPAGSDDLDAVAGGGRPGWIVRGWNWGNAESDWPPSTEEPWSQVSFLASVLSSVQDVSTLLLGWEVLRAKWKPVPCVRVAGKPFFSTIEAALVLPRIHSESNQGFRMTWQFSLCHWFAVSSTSREVCWPIP